MKKIIILITAITLLLATGVTAYILTRPKFGNLEIKSNLKEIEVSVNNDKKIIKIPYNERVLAGQYVIKVSMKNYSPFEQTVTIEKNKTSVVEITLTSLNESSEEEETIQFFDKNALLAYLPTSGEYFLIDFYQKGSSDIFYKITLLTKNDPQKNKEAYDKELKEYKEKALSWIKNKGANPDELFIEWVPQETSSI